jgi:hypothetical protein
MSEKTQGKTPENMNNQEKSMNQLSEDKDGFTQTWNTVGAGTHPTLERA